MGDISGLIFVGPQQAAPVLVALVLWVGLAGLGYLVTGRDRITEANVFFGWAAIAIVFTAVGVLVPGSFLILAVGAGLLALVGIALAWRRGESVFVPGSWRVVVLALPLLLIAGAMDPSQWDEFSHWLPAARFLVATDGFPTADRTFSGFVGYPYGWPLLMYLGARIGGRFFDNIGGQFNLLMLLTFAVFALRTAFAVAGKPRGRIIGWPFAAAAALVATAFNPTFVQKIVLTAYSDVGSAVATGVAILIGYHMLARLTDGDKRASLGAAWQLALAFTLLIDIRPPSIVVVLSVVAGLILIALRDRTVSTIRLLRFLPLILLPGLVLYLIWRGYVVLELAGSIGNEESLRPWAQWDFSLVPDMLAAMADVAFKKVAFFIPMFCACAIGLRALVNCRNGLDRIAILVASVFSINLVFLMVIYIGHFGGGGARSAISFWRYNIDVGMTAVIFITTGALWLWRDRASFDRYPKWLAPLAIVLVVALPFGFVTKLRFDLEPPKPYYVSVAKDLRPRGHELGNVYVADPAGNGEAAVITRYYLDLPVTYWLSAFQGPTPQIVAAYLGHIKPGDHVLIHSLTPGLAEAIGQTLDARRSYLFRRDANGWTFVRDWPKPVDHPH